MYSLEKRLDAINLLIKYDMCYTAVIRELGYPSKEALRKWYYEYLESGTLHTKHRRSCKYSDEQKRAAVNYYIDHGKSVSRTVRILGYPSRPLLDKWILELAPKEKRHCRVGGTNVKYSQEHKEQAVISLCTRNNTAEEVAKDFNVARVTLYGWKRKMTNEESVIKMDNNSTNNKNQENKESNDSNIIEEKVNLETQVKELRKEVRRLKIERDIYEKAAELIKKDQGINLKSLTNREKTVIINALRESYKLVELLEILEISKSSYFYQAKAIEYDKYSEIRIKIKEIYTESAKTYGYRRIHSVLKSSKIKISEKVVRRIMKEDNLLVKITLRKKYNSYKGEISPEVENLVKRDFHAKAPNVKWLTDITEFSLPAGKVYLSPIIDCFDGLPVSWMIGTSPNAELVNTMLDEAIYTLKTDENPIVHSDYAEKNTIPKIDYI